MTSSAKGNTTHMRCGHRNNAPSAGRERQAGGMGGAVPGCHGDADPRFQRVADLAATVEGLSELTQTMILGYVEAKKRQTVDHRQPEPTDDSGTTPVATPQPESVSSVSELRSAPQRMKRIEYLLKMLGRAYGTINRFMATGGSTDRVDNDRENVR